MLLIIYFDKKLLSLLIPLPWVLLISNRTLMICILMKYIFFFLYSRTSLHFVDLRLKHILSLIHFSKTILTTQSSPMPRQLQYIQMLLSLQLKLLLVLDSFLFLAPSQSCLSQFYVNFGHVLEHGDLAWHVCVFKVQEELAELLLGEATLAKPLPYQFGDLKIGKMEVNLGNLKQGPQPLFELDS